MDYDYQLRGGELKVKVVKENTWDVTAIRSDNGKKDTFPIRYFYEQFKKIK